MVLLRKGEENRHDMACDSGLAEDRQCGSKRPRRGGFRTARSTSQQQRKQRRKTASEHPMSNDSSESDRQHDKQSEWRFAKACVGHAPLCDVCVSLPGTAGDPFSTTMTSAIAPPERNAFSSGRGETTLVRWCVLHGT